MPTFLWTGKDVGGHERSERVEAENAQEAKQILAGRGWTNLELLKDEIGDMVSKNMPPPEWMKEEYEKENTPEKEAAYVKGKRAPGVLSQTWDGIKESFKAILVCALLLFLGLYLHRWLMIVVGALGLAFCILLTPVIHLVISFFSKSSQGYARLNNAKVWGRWDEVLKLVEELRGGDALTGVSVPELELTRCRSQALAALGRLDEGVAEFKKFENSPRLERWMYLTYLAGIFDSAQKFEEGLALRRQAAAEKPDTATVWIDVAYAAVRRLNHIPEAKEALARAEKLEMVGLGKPYVHFLRGIIAWRERNPSEAKGLLEKALVGFQPHAHHALMEGLLLLTKAYLCSVRGQLGDSAEAKRLFGEVEEFLVANKEDELLAACRAVVPGR